MSNTEFTDMSVVLLKKLHDLLPTLRGRLAPIDYANLCRRLASVGETIAGGADRAAVQRHLEDIVRRLDTRLPGIAARMSAQHRGVAVAGSAVGTHEARQMAADCSEKARWVLAMHENEEEAKRSSPLGLAELWVLDHLPLARKQQAVRIRDWCEDRLEFIHSRGGMQYYTGHGIGHSKRVLRHAVALLRAQEGHFPGPLSCLVTYAAAYAHDLGLMFRPSEDPNDERTFELIRSSHGQRTLETILGSPRDGLPPAWRAMGFHSEREAMLVAHVCAVHQRRSECLLTRLPVSMPLFADGCSSNIPARALAVIVRLADALDCNEKRLPPLAYLRDSRVPTTSVLEYVKHEIVEDVQIDDDSVIHVAMRVRYEYPTDVDLVAEARAELHQEISAVIEMLKGCGVQLPPPEFSCFESLFPEPHPYLREDSNDS